MAAEVFAMARAHGSTTRRPPEGEAPLGRTVAAAVIAALRERILHGDFGEGEQLRQDAIAEEFGVSRIPVREALRQLEAEGLVTLYAHRGAVVTQLSPSEIGELFELRALLECDMLRRAIPHIDDLVIARASAVLEEFEAAFAAGNVRAWGTLNWEFHSTLYKPAERSRSLSIDRILHNNTDRYSRMQLLFTEWTDRANREHRAILDLCRKRRNEEAVEALRSHILSAGRSLVEYLEQERRGR
jgi:DNA-binding GntR family transcriptional regulator